jgi:hypothetical protein
MGQSSNDTFPTAMHIAAAVAIKNDLSPPCSKIAADLEAKAKAWDKIVKIGRTHLQDATPIRLGQEFSGYASQMRHAEERLTRALSARSANSPSAAPPSARASTRHRRVRQARRRGTHQDHRHATSARRATTSRPSTPRMRTSRPPATSRPSRSASPRSPTTSAGWAPAPAAASANCAPGRAARLVHHARQGEPRHLRIAHHGLLPGRRQRRRRHHGGFGGVGSMLDLNVAMPVMAAATCSTRSTCSPRVSCVHRQPAGGATLAPRSGERCPSRGRGR